MMLRALQQRAQPADIPDTVGRQNPVEQPAGGGGVLFRPVRARVRGLSRVAVHLSTLPGRRKEEAPRARAQVSKGSAFCENQAKKRVTNFNYLLLPDEEFA